VSDGAGKRLTRPAHPLPNTLMSSKSCNPTVGPTCSVGCLTGVTALCEDGRGLPGVDGADWSRGELVADGALILTGVDVAMAIAAWCAVSAL
jgi:hypothetical protein